MQLASISLFSFPMPILAFFSSARIEYKPFSKDGRPVAFTQTPLYFQIPITPVATES